MNSNDSARATLTKHNIEGCYFSQESLPSSLGYCKAGHSLFIKSLLFVYVVFLCIISGVISGLFGSYVFWELIVNNDSYKTQILWMVLIVASWLITFLAEGSYKSMKLLIFLFILSGIVTTFLSNFNLINVSRTASEHSIASIFINSLGLIFAIVSFFTNCSALALIYASLYTYEHRLRKVCAFLTVVIALSTAIYFSSFLRAISPDNSLKLTATAMLGGTLSSLGIVLASLVATYFSSKNFKHFKFIKDWAIAVGSWRGTSFYNLDLSNLDFTGAKVANTDFRALKLYRTCLRDVTGLERARVDNRYLDLDNPKVQNLLTKGRSEDKNFSKINLQGAYLRDAYLREFNLTQTNLTGAELQNANLRETLLINANLTGTNLQNANLRESRLIDADLTRAELQGADLTDCFLVRTQVINVNFTGAKLTGACIQDWSVSSQTRFTNVECDYVYRKLDEQGNRTDRYPLKRNFEPGEFESLYEEVENIIELVFKEGLNWRAFSFAFYELQTEEGELELELKGVEQRKNLWVVKVTYNENILRQLVEERLSVIYEKYAEKERLFAAREEDFKRLLSTTEKQASALLAHAETIQGYSKRPFGNSFVILGSTIANLAGSGKIEYNEASNTIRSLVANGEDRAQVTSLVQSLITQFQEKGIAKTDEQAELIQQIILAVAGENPEFKQLFVQQGQQIVDAVPEGEIATAIRNALIQLIPILHEDALNYKK